MNKIRKIASGFDVEPLYSALSQNPNLWNLNNARTQSEQSPHHEVDDIWVRYAEDWTVLGPHESIWYPAAEILPVKELCFRLMRLVDGERLGGVLITKIKPGKKCRPHKDFGWHASYYEKFAIQVRSAAGQGFHVEEESLYPETGDVYQFKNNFLHWVDNNSDQDRITMIVCLKTSRKDILCLGE